MYSFGSTPTVKLSYTRLTCHVLLGPPGILLRRTDSAIKTMGCDTVDVPLEKTLWSMSAHPIQRQRHG